jgi:hypothetical protein
VRAVCGCRIGLRLPLTRLALLDSDDVFHSSVQREHAGEQSIEARIDGVAGLARGHFLMFAIHTSPSVAVSVYVIHRLSADTPTLSPIM